MKISTIYGDMDENALTRTAGEIDNAVEHTVWVEYHLNDEIVHRSVHVTLKTGPDFITGEIRTF